MPHTVPSRSVAARTPVSTAGHCWLCLHGRPSNTQRQVWFSLLWGSLHLSLGPHEHEVSFAPSKHLWKLWDLILNAIASLIPSCWDFSFALGHGVSFFGGIQHPPIDGFSAASCDFGVLAGDEHMSFYPTILIFMDYKYKLYNFNKSIRTSKKFNSLLW